MLGPSVLKYTSNTKTRPIFFLDFVVLVISEAMCTGTKHSLHQLESFSWPTRHLRFPTMSSREPTPSSPFIHRKLTLHDDAFLYHAIKPILSQDIANVLDLMVRDQYNKPQTTRALALHCINVMFEPCQDSHITKETAYKDFKYYYNKVYPAEKFPSIGFPQFGKLMKVAHHFTTRRIGSRTGSKYCYSNVRITRMAQEWFEQYRPRLPKVSFMDEMMRFHSIPQPITSDVDDVFVQFLYNEVMDYKTVDVSNRSMSYLLTMLAKSDMLLKNFMQLINHQGVFDRFISDWYGLGIMKLIGETVDLSEDVLQFISTFPLVLDPVTAEEYKDQRYKMPLVKCLKVEFSHQKGHPQKLKIVNFLVELCSMFPTVAFPTYILNFKYVTTSVLRHLTLQKSASFSTYWVLGCFLDEFTQFLLEYYASRRGPKLNNPKNAKTKEESTTSYISTRETSVMSSRTSSSGK